VSVHGGWCVIVQTALVKTSEVRWASQQVGLKPRSNVRIRRGAPTELEFKARANNLSFGGVRPSEREYERVLGTNDLVDEFYLERALRAAEPVCRIVVRSASGKEINYATGVMVSPSLLLTNWHVFRTADQAENGIAEFNYTLDIRGNPEPSHRFLVRPDRFFYASRELDFALVAVHPASLEGPVPLSRFGFHSLVPAPGKIREGEWITIIQHPGGQRRQYAIRENELLAKAEKFLWYASDTAPGSSGSPAFNDSFQIVALHHSGKARQKNGKYLLRNGALVGSLDGLDDSEIDWESNEGIRVSVLCDDMRKHLPSGSPHVTDLMVAMKDGGVLSTLGQEVTSRPDVTYRLSVPGPGIQAIVVPVSLRVSLDLDRGGVGQPAAAAAVGGGDAAAAGVDAGSEKAVAPPIDTDYSNRKGYDSRFLGVVVPLPEVSSKKEVARLEDGSYIIPYEHFSVVMHKVRRLALFTASNVEGAKALRAPEPGIYTRDALGGKSKNDSELWVSDPRIPEQHQLPNRFYDKDRKAFDKGHVVRREDVCWGMSRAQIVKANADTFHTTNCSPQVDVYNQSKHRGIWGLLEDSILGQVKGGGGKAPDRFTVFAGPIFRDDDREFEGVDDRGPVVVKIPRAFWKIVILKKGAKLRSFGFVLEQDLSRVRFAEDFIPAASLKAHLRPLSAIQKMLVGMKLPKVVLDADGGS
jgi:endonuclease G, mitochondrial